mgnify:CR=1 FL=1
MTNIPRTETYVSSDKHEYYERLRNDANSLFYKMDYIDIYVAAAAIGYYKRECEPIKGTKTSIGVMSLMSSDNPKLWILKSIAVAIKGIEILENLKDVAATVEGYANSGIDWLIKFHNAGEDEVYSMAVELMDIIESEIIQQSS